MRYTPLVRIAKAAGVAALFALSGYYTGARLVSLYAESNGSAILLLGLPFAAVCALTMLRSAKALYIVPAIAALWSLACLLTFGIAIFRVFHQSAVAYFIGPPVSGCLGAWLVAAAVGIEHPRIFSGRSVPIVAGLGLILGLAFSPGLYNPSTGFNFLFNSPNPAQSRALIAALVVWQTVIGTQLYLRVQSTSALHCA